MRSNDWWCNNLCKGEPMKPLDDLLERLRKSGIPIENEVAEAMQQVFIGSFTDFELDAFWHDRPVPFLITQNDAAKTISAPHMIATLLHHLELLVGQHVLLIGAKGGYLAALIDHIVGKDGMVTVLEPHQEVQYHTEERLEFHESKGTIRVLPVHSLEDNDEATRGIDRVLITGAVREIPLTVAGMVEEGGFVLGPFGGPIQQTLLKRERQGEDWLDTELGNVVFGPMDLSEAERDPLDPQALADHIEDALNIIIELVEIDSETIQRIEELVQSLRGMPSDIPPLDEDSSEDELVEHPVFELLMAEMEWLQPMWPLFGQLLAIDIDSPGDWDDDEPPMVGGHEDLVP
jgi:protein-L-isoaspartate(D-aspartate) O-methyltransferase